MLTFVEAIHALEDGPGGRDRHGIRRMCWDDGIIVNLSNDGRLSFSDPHGINYTLESDDVAGGDWVVRPLPEPPADDPPPTSGLTFADAVAHLRAHPADTARRAAWVEAVAEPGVPFYGFISVDDGTVYYHDRDGDTHLEMDGAFEHVLADDWAIVPNPAVKTPPTGRDAGPEKTTGLTFTEAVAWLRSHRSGAIRRACWPSNGMSVRVNGYRLQLFYENQSAHGFNPSTDTILATDWEVVP